MGLNSGSLSRAGTGAATGATIGSIIPGVGTGLGAVAGGGLSLLYDLGDSIFGGSSGPSAEEVAAQQKLDAMRKASQQIQAYRPIAAQGRMQNMQNRMGMYQGVANTLQGMYGGAPPQAPTARLDSGVRPMPQRQAPIY